MRDVNLFQLSFADDAVSFAEASRELIKVNVK